MVSKLSQAYVDAVTRMHTGGSDGECKVRPIVALKFGQGHKRGMHVKPGCKLTRSLRRHMRAQKWEMQRRRRAETALLQSCPLQTYTL